MVRYNYYIFVIANLHEESKKKPAMQKYEIIPGINLQYTDQAKNGRQLTIQVDSMISIRNYPAAENNAKKPADPGAASSDALKNHVLDLLSCIEACAHSPQKEVDPLDSHREITQKAYSYLMEHKNRRITIETLARVLSVSETGLKQSFYKVYGESVYVLVRRWKMLSAADMLAHTDFSILDIAVLHGYSNGGKFAAAFSKIFGVKPSEYRKQAQQFRY